MNRQRLSVSDRWCKSGLVLVVLALGMGVNGCSAPEGNFVLSRDIHLAVGISPASLAIPPGGTGSATLTITPDPPADGCAVGVGFEDPHQLGPIFTPPSWLHIAFNPSLFTLNGPSEVHVSATLTLDASAPPDML